MAFPPNFDHVWDLTQPPDTQLLNQGALDFRSLKDDIMQRMSLQSGVIANRPTPETVNAVWGGAGFGLLYFSTDTKQIFQWSGVAWVDVTSSFIPPPITSGGGSGSVGVVATLNILNQSADVPSTGLYIIPASGAGLYRLSIVTAIMRAASSSSNLPQSVVQYTSLDSVAVNSLFVSNSNGANTLGLVGGISVSAFSIVASSVIACAASTAILVLTNGYTSTGGVSMLFSFRARLEYLG